MKMAECIADLRRHGIYRGFVVHEWIHGPLVCIIPVEVGEHNTRWWAAHWDKQGSRDLPTGHRCYQYGDAWQCVEFASIEQAVDAIDALHGRAEGVVA